MRASSVVALLLIAVFDAWLAYVATGFADPSSAAWWAFAAVGAAVGLGLALWGATRVGLVVAFLAQAVLRARFVALGDVLSYGWMLSLGAALALSWAAWAAWTKDGSLRIALVFASVVTALTLIRSAWLGQTVAAGRQVLFLAALVLLAWSSRSVDLSSPTPPARA